MAKYLDDPDLSQYVISTKCVEALKVLIEAGLIASSKIKSIDGVVEYVRLEDKIYILDVQVVEEQ